MIRKLIKIALICLVLLFLYKCFFEKSRWEQLHGRGLASSGESLSAMKFISPMVGFIGGDSFADIPAESMITESKSFIYKTKDGGQSWEKHYLSKGFVEQIESVDDAIFALQRVHTENSFRNLKSEIWKSEDLGNTWNRVYSSQLPFYIKNIQFVNKSIGIGILGKQYDGRDEEYIALTTDGCKTFKIVDSISDITNFIELRLYKSGLVYISGNKIKYYDFSKKEAKIIYEKPGVLSCVMSKDNNGNIWIVDKMLDSMALMKLDSSEKFTIKPIGNKVAVGNPYSLHVEGDSISLFVYGYSSILGADHDFYHSDDAGASWEKENIPFDLIVKPISYFGKDLIWAGSGAGSLKFRKPKS